MKNYIYLICVLLLVFLFNACSSEYKFEYIQTVGNPDTVTRIEVNSIKSGNNTYFTLGKYNKKEIPESYIKPNYSGFTSGFEIIINWENDTCNFNYYTGDFSVSNNAKDFKVRKVTVKQFMRMKMDTTGYFNYQIESAMF